MKKPGVILPVFVFILFSWASGSFSQTCEIQWWGDLSGSVATNETSRTEQATYEAYLAIFSGGAPAPNCGGSPYECWFGFMAPMCFEWKTTQAGFWGMRNTNEHGCTQYTHTGGWDVVCVYPPECSVSPLTLDFGTVFVGGSKDMYFSVTNTGGGTLNGTVSESCSHYSIISGGGSYSLGAGQSHAVTVRFAPASAGQHNCTIETGDALCNDVSCTGVGENPPECAIFPDTLDFGAIAPGDSTDTTFTITNTGGGNLTGNVNESCDSYSIVSGEGPYSLAAGGFRVVTIRFQPTTNGQFDCMVETGSALCNAVFCKGRGDITVPVAVQSFQSRWADNHIEITWKLIEACVSPSFDILRRIEAAVDYDRIIDPDIVRSGDIFIFKDQSTEPGKTYSYLVVIFEDGRPATSFETSLTTPSIDLVLFQNHPNPFNPTTTISFTLPVRAHTNLSVFNLKGRLVKNLVDDMMDKGAKEIEWDASDTYGNPLSSGVYFYRLVSGNKVLTRKLVLIK